MTFLAPVMLLSLGTLPFFAGLYILLQRRRLTAQRTLIGYTHSPFPNRPGLRRHLPPALFLSGLAILGLALARPQAVVNLPRIEGTVILAFDVSGSMAADDLEPTRMEAAKAAAREFVARQPSTVQIGVVAFSDGGLAVLEPTDDQQAILDAINRLEPTRGTSVGHGILASLEAIAAAGPDASDESAYPAPPTPTPVPEGTYASAVIVLLTDGENNEAPDPFAAAQAARERGVRVHTIGIGSAEGALLEVEGFTVHTRLDEGVLMGIANLTGGSYYNAADEEDLRSIYEDISPQLVVKPEKMEVTSIFVGASLAVLLLGAAFSLLWFSRLP